MNDLKNLAESLPLDIQILKVIETVVILLVFLLIKSIASKVIDRAAIKFDYEKVRAKVIKKLINIVALILVAIILLAIWGIKQTEITVFVSSMLTVLGIAFFAQWSILSNITSSVIIFFNHPITVGDNLTIMDKDYEIEGKISDIGIFFITIKTTKGELVSTPSSVFMQKMVKRNH